MDERSLRLLRKAAARCPAVLFRPRAFFVARCGVLTVVFDGFSGPILDLKNEIEGLFPDLEEEHEGSTWAKVTLAVLKDDRNLKPRDIVRLRDLADEWNEVLRSRGDLLDVHELAAVNYGCRSLELRIETHRLPLRSSEREATAEEEHAAYVADIVAQFSRERMDRYAAELEKDGHRESHYRLPAEGWSLVVDIAPDRMPLSNSLLEEVERAVPGKYCVLEPASRHITVRSLVRRPDKEGGASGMGASSVRGAAV